MPQASEDSPGRVILLLSDCWSGIRDGVSGINKSLSQSLARYKSIHLYSIVFTEASKINESARKEAADSNVILISLTSNGTSASEVYKNFSTNPLAYLPDIKSQIPQVHQIVGHVPITGRASLIIRDQLYPEAKLVLFFHIIPEEIQWLTDDVPYSVPSNAELVRLGEEADYVYSVTGKLHWYNTAKFRNRAQQSVDHHLFLPQCSKEVFAISRELPQHSHPIILVLGDDGGMDSWLGLDIAACAVNKVAKVLPPSLDGITLLVYGVVESKIQETRNKLMQFIDQPTVTLDIAPFSDQKDYLDTLKRCTMCVVPNRAEPFGYSGLHALSAGVPTVVSEHCALTSVVKRLTLEPDYTIAPVIQSTSSVLQDASVWRDRILERLQDMATAHDRAQQLQTALKRDEDTKESHDNFIALCLGGIRLTLEAQSLSFLYSRDEEKELPILRSFNRFLSSTLKQTWRFKHHPLTEEADLLPLLPRLRLPVSELKDAVINKIEDRDRRILDVDRSTGSLIVFCPSVDSLTDLWAMCDRINHALSSRLIEGEENPVLSNFKLKKVKLRTVISGPEFLRYKQELRKTVSS